MPSQLLSKPQTPAMPEHAMPPDELGWRARDETASFRRREPHNDRYCLELFRRAVVAHDDCCWSELFGMYHDQVRAWCQRSGAASADCLDELQALTWERFWRSYTPQKLTAAHGLPSVLRYLKLCARSVVIDQVRARTPGQNALPDLPAGGPSLVSDTALDLATRVAFWESVDRHLRSEAEQVLVQLMYVVGMKSAAVQAHRPDLFPSVADVYRLTRNILDRLRRSPALRAWSADIEAEGGLSESASP